MTTATTTLIEVRHESRAVLLAEEAAGMPRRCEACGVLCRDVETNTYWIGGRGHEARTWCSDRETCEARQEAA